MSTVLLVEELRFRRRRGVFCGVVGSRREPGVVAGREGGQGRPEAARRGSLDGSGSVLEMMDGEARQGFLVAGQVVVVGGLHGDGDGTQLGHLQVPNEFGGGSAGARVPVIPSPRRGGMEWCGRSQAGSIKRATSPRMGGS
jgi:hypothetical protein